MTKKKKKHTLRPPRIFISKTGKLYTKINGKVIKIKTNMSPTVLVKTVINNMSRKKAVPTAKGSKTAKMTGQHTTKAPTLFASSKNPEVVAITKTIETGLNFFAVENQIKKLEDAKEKQQKLIEEEIKILKALPGSTTVPLSSFPKLIAPPGQSLFIDEAGTTSIIDNIQIEKYRNKLSRSKDKLKRNRDQIILLSKESKTKADELEDNLRKLEDIKDELDKKKDDNDKLRHQFETLKNEGNLLNETIKQTKEENEQVKKEIDETTTKLTDINKHYHHRLKEDIVDTFLKNRYVDEIPKHLKKLGVPPEYYYKDPTKPKKGIFSKIKITKNIANDPKLLNKVTKYAIQNKPQFYDKPDFKKHLEELGVDITQFNRLPRYNKEGNLSDSGTTKPEDWKVPLTSEDELSDLSVSSEKESNRNPNKEESKIEQSNPEPEKQDSENPPSGGYTLEDGLYNTQIEKMMKPFHKYGFKGVISADEMSKLIPHIRKGEKISFIMNLDKSTQPGSHWVAVYLDPNESLEYYDSFGREPPESFNKDILFLINKIHPDVYLKYKVNKIIDQSSTSKNCGFFAMKFLLDRYKGIPFKDCTGYNNAKKGEKEIESFKKKYESFKYI